MLYPCFASFKQSPLDFFKLVDSRLILMLLYDSLNLIISGVHQSYLGCWVIRQKKWSWEVWTMLHTRCANALSYWRTKIIIRNVFGSYLHFVEMVEHFNNAIHWHAIHAWWRITSILDMAPKRRQIWCAKQVAECLVPFLGLVLWTYPIVYEWKRV